MTNTITLTDEQMKALQSGQSITIEPPKPVITKWEPKGGEYKVKYDLTGATLDTSIMVSELQSGLRYNNKSQAKQAAKALRSYARQLAWLAENDDGWVADWSTDTQSKYKVLLCASQKKHVVEANSDYNSLNTIYMSRSNAEKLCKLLNDKIVKL